MKEQREVRGLAIAALFVIAAVLAGADSAGAAPKGSPWGESYFPNVPLITQDGKSVRFYDDLLKDKIVTINFIYASCVDACPLETAKLREVQQLLSSRVGVDVFMYSITIDPTHDTPAILKDYAERFGVGPGWLFLTGKQADIDGIRKKVGLYTEPTSDAVNDHTASFIIGNEASGQWMQGSTLDNPRYLAVMIGDWMSDWKERKAVRSYAEVPKLAPPEKGQHLFQTRCAACHTIGKGDGLGPDLLGVTTSRDRGWLSRWLTEPDRMLKEGDPLATALLAKYKNVPMPNLRLGQVDVDALLTYLEVQTAARLEAPKATGSAELASSGSEHHDHDHHHDHHHDAVKTE